VIHASSAPMTCRRPTSSAGIVQKSRG
jgi:hypothetical protein